MKWLTNAYKVPVEDFIPNIIARNMFSMLTIKVPLGNFTELQRFKFDIFPLNF